MRYKRNPPDMTNHGHSLPSSISGISPVSQDRSPKQVPDVTVPPSMNQTNVFMQAQPQTAFTPHLNKHSSMFSKGNAFGLDDPEPLESQDQAASTGANPSGSNLNSSNVSDPL